MTILTIPQRFEGPPRVVNGGWLAGLLAVAAGHPSSGTATLRKPTPVETALTMSSREGSTAVHLGAVELAAVTDSTPDFPAAAAVTWGAACAAAPSYIGLIRHPFPGCLVCGTQRSETDALCLRPGRISTDVVAAPWEPAEWTDDGTGHVAWAAVWAALDCPSAWAIDDEGRSVVLGRLSVRIIAQPRVGAKHVVVGWVRERTSRRVAQCGSAVYDESGAVLAVAASTWFTVDMATFGQAVANVPESASR